MLACQAVRQAAAESNKCTCAPGGKDPRAQCQGVEGPPASCALWGLAGRRDKLFKARFSPQGLLGDSQAHRMILTDLETDVAKLERQVIDAFPTLSDAEVEKISYPYMAKCTINENGQPLVNPATGKKTKKYTRDMLQGYGYRPDPLLNIIIPPAYSLPAQITDIVPVSLDRIAPPEIILLVLFVLLLCVGMLVSYYRKANHKQPNVNKTKLNTTGGPKNIA